MRLNAESRLDAETRPDAETRLDAELRSSAVMRPGLVSIVVINLFSATVQKGLNSFRDGYHLLSLSTCPKACVSINKAGYTANPVAYG